MITDFKALDAILAEHGYDKVKLIAILQDIQKEQRYLPVEALQYIAEKLGVTEAEVLGVTTFYENFSMEPKGKYIIRSCDGTACHVRKADDVRKVLYEMTGTSIEKKTSDDMLFTVECVSCLGACGLAPVCTVNDVVYAQMTPDKMRDLINSLKEAEKA